MGPAGRKRLRVLAMIAVVDFLIAITLVQQDEIARMRVETRKPSVVTYGQFAVTMTWPGKKTDDMDLWTQDPDKNICYFRATQVAHMQLEHDDLGDTASAYTVDGKKVNFERVVIRTVTPGEYIVNGQAFSKTADGPVPVTFELWTLRGDDRVLVKRMLVFTGEKEQRTAFRVTIDSRGHISQVNQLPADLAAHDTGGSSPYATPSAPASGGRPEGRW